ncbi:two-component regulator propeller domain-containing protein [Empedobacter brevis]|uniref:type IX secretion system anionic LPS delivery protein PorZ n=1 Tax=Empedobacter brevis TaxID=247 RepID=UPI0023EF585A|nr:two-component regulator propeller domain-containing protein [Empedobacter brevis]
MKTKLFIIIAMIFTGLNAQNDKARWNDLFSYNNVKLLEEVNGVIYCGTENGIFLFNSQNPTSNWIKLNKTNFLNNVGVSAMAYDLASDSFLVGYENGGLDLLHSGESTMVLDIKWNGFNGDKKVNHIYINENIAFISGAFGIVSYDLKDEEFKETTRTNLMVVNDAVIKDNVLYIATTNGIYSSALQNKLNNPNINSWTTIISGPNISNIELFNNEIYYSTGNQLNVISGSLISQTFNYIEDLKASNDRLIVTQSDQVSVLNGSTDKIVYQEKDGNGILQNLNMNFNSGIFINDNLYGATTKFGLINFSLKSDYEVENPFGYSPDGPYNNKSWSVTAKNGKVWIAPGEMDSYVAPKLNADGFSYFNKKNWMHFSSNSLNEAKDIVNIAVDPTNDNHFLASSYFEYNNWETTSKKIGVFEIELNPDSTIKKQTHITDPIPWLYRVAGATFDNEGTLYVSHTLLDGDNTGRVNHLVVRKNGSWKVNKRTNQGISNPLSPIIDNKYIYIPQAREGGVAVLRKDTYEFVGSVLRSGEQTLPSNDVWSAALDKSGNLWIGTGQGLAVTYGIESAVDNSNFSAEPIVIIQDGIPEALLTDIGIYAIKVDNANRKWITTNGAGVYYVSDNGEETKLHFTTKNSPLPSDIVYDVSIDESTGKVYFATEKGVVSYNGDVSIESTNFNNAIVYPNPYRPEYKGNITIKNLPNRALVKITDVVGNLIFEKKADGGVVEWNTNNAKGKPVASGIYLVLMTNADGTETKTLKIAVVR